MTNYGEIGLKFKCDECGQPSHILTNMPNGKTLCVPCRKKYEPGNVLPAPVLKRKRKPKKAKKPLKKAVRKQ